MNKGRMTLATRPSRRCLDFQELRRRAAPTELKRGLLSFPPGF